MPKEAITDITAEKDNKTTDAAEEAAIGVVQADITTEMQKAYIDYAMSVIVSRALPDVRDGLKPVHRRIIYAMQEQNMVTSGKFYKCATVIGQVLGKYHPHGDTSVYDALVRMGQTWSLRYPLIFPQGNFGSVDGDPPAAMRYTECKMHKIAEELYRDIQNETVDFVLNDLQNKEPVYLPSVLPNMLLNGASGIAVGMATNIPPHNLNEIIDGLLLSIEKAENLGTTATDKNLTVIDTGLNEEYKTKVAKPAFESSATVEDLVVPIKGPDFPTGGTIYNHKEIVQMYATGKGRVLTRAKMETEEMKGGKMRLVVTELPYQVNKATLVSKIAALHKQKKVIGISDLRDESNRKGMRIVIELKRDVVVKKVQNQLYKHTQLQSTFNSNMVALLDGEPKLMTLKTILEEFIKHRQQVVIRRTIFFLKKLKGREHILLGLKIALDNLDEVIKLIRASKTVEVAKTGLMKNFKLSDIQAQAILDMQLRRLAALERQKIEDELKEIKNTIKGHEELLADPKLVMEVIKAEFAELKKKYGDARRTKVIKGSLDRLGDEDLVVNERCIITISESGYIKRLKESTYKKQGRGGKGVKGQDLREEDVVKTIKTCQTHDHALFFTNKGKVYKLRIWEIPETSRTSKGTALVNFLNIRQGEQVEALLTVDSTCLKKSTGFVMFGTTKGRVKKTAIKDFANIRTSGIIAIKLATGDQLSWARMTTGHDDIMLTTTQGQSIRFHENDARPMGRSAAGVMGIKLTKEEDSVVGMTVIPKESKGYKLMVISASGMGKKTKASEYKVQNRGGSGILTYKVTTKTGKLVVARLLNDKTAGDLLLVTKKGKIIRLDEKQIPTLGRATLGVKLMKMGAGDKLISAALLEAEDTECIVEEQKK